MIEDPRIVPKGAPARCPSDTKIKAVKGGYELSGTIYFERSRNQLFCPGARHTWLGLAENVADGAIDLIDSAADDPLIFEVTPDRGYTYRSGKGHIVIGALEIALPPSKEAVSLYQAQRLVTAGELGAALPLIRGALARESALPPPLRAAAWEMKSRALAGTGSLAEAAEAKRQETDVRRPLYDAREAFAARDLVQLGELWAKAGSPSKACAAYEEALTRFPPEPPDRADERASLLLRIGSIKHNEGRSKEAAAAYDRALEILDRAANDPKMAGILMVALSNRGELARTDGDLPTAERLLERAVRIGKERAQSTDLGFVSAQSNLAALYYDQGLATKAVALLRRVLQEKQTALGPKSPELLSAMANLGAAAEASGDVTLARDTFAAALQLKGPDSRGSLADRSYVIHNYAGLLHKLGRLREAKARALEALAIREKLFVDGDRSISSTEQLLGDISDSAGDPQEAERLYRRSIERDRRLLGPLHFQYASSLSSLCSLHERRAAYDLAASCYREVLAIRERALGPMHPNVAESLNNLGTVLRDKGDDHAAEAMFRRAVSILGPSRLRSRSYAVALTNLATVLPSSARPEALDSLRSALEVFEATPGGERDAATVLATMGLLHDQWGDHATAEVYHRRALKVRMRRFPRLKADIGTSANNLGSCLLAQGRIGEAIASLEKAVRTRAEALGPDHIDVARSLQFLAMAYQEKRLFARALTTLQRAAQIEEKHLALSLTSGDEREKLIFMASVRAATNQELTVALRLPGSRAANEFAALTVLRRKARVLESLIAQAQSRNVVVPDGAGQRLTANRAELAGLLFRGPGADEKRYRDRVAELEDERRRLESELGDREVHELGVIRPVELADLRRALPPASVFLDFVQFQPFVPNAGPGGYGWGPPRLLVVVVRPRGPAVVHDLCSAADVGAAVDALRSALTSGAAEPARQASELLYRLLLEPIASLLEGSERLLVSPDGALNLLPFEALRDASGGFVLDRWLTAYVSSGRDLAAPRAWGSKPLSRAVLIGDPSFGDPTPLFATPTSTGATTPGTASLPTFTRLPGTGLEIGILHELLSDSVVLSGAAATEGALRGLKSPRLLHIATHGFFMPPRPSNAAGAELAALLSSADTLTRSGLALAGANRRSSEAADDGIVTALEIASLDLKGTQLVTLSACDTGLGEPSLGEGVFGIRRALMMAGSASQIVGLWKVGDRDTLAIMSDFYRRLAAGARVAEALRFAKQARKDKEGSTPFSWAGFVFSGTDVALGP